MFITFLTDFGLEDDFVGTCHGVIKRIAPDVEIIDVTHGISPQSILQGALVLANTLPFLPEGVHLAVVDPGVGSGRRALALGGIDVAHEIANREYALDHVSSTFHGRDIFAPAAAHLARGVEIAELGPEVEPDSLVRLELPTPDLTERRIRATCLYVDRFGNIQLNLNRGHLEQYGIEPGRLVELEHMGDRYYASAAKTFADARPGEVILYEDAYENVALAISRGNAAETFNVSAGAEIRIRRAE